MAKKIQLRHGVVLLAIIRILHDGNRTGYDLMVETDYPSGSIYPALSRMHAAGYIQIASSVQDKGPQGTVYQLTESGREWAAPPLALLQMTPKRRTIKGVFAPA
jgi:DNA-binding PadR family transcriptional regulator